jgi:hypothetical protein
MKYNNSLTRLIATDRCSQNELLSTGFAIIRTQKILVKKYKMNSLLIKII